VSDRAPEGTGPDPLAVIADLTAELKGVREDLRSLRDELRSVRDDSEARDTALADSARRRGRVIAALVVSFCLDLLITAGFGWNTIRVNDTQNASRASDVRQCQLANVTRAQDIAIWNRVLADRAPAAGTPKAAAELARVNHLIKVKDTPRDCTAAYRAAG
jgi:hypothetical protein